MENRFLSIPTKKVYSSYEIHTPTALRKGCWTIMALIQCNVFTTDYYSIFYR